MDHTRARRVARHNAGPRQGTKRRLHDGHGDDLLEGRLSQRRDTVHVREQRHREALGSEDSEHGLDQGREVGHADVRLEGRVGAVFLGRDVDRPVRVVQQAVHAVPTRLESELLDLGARQQRVDAGSTRDVRVRGKSPRVLHEQACDVLVDAEHHHLRGERAGGAEE